VRSQPVVVDTDGDGTPDHQDDDMDGDDVLDVLDDDTDGDGIPDVDEGSDDVDGDGLPNYRDTDSDGDGLPDAEEPDQDLDGDGLPARLDADDSAGRSSTDPDGDGIPSRVEGGEDADADGDGAPNYLDEDSDGDGIPDAVEGGSRRPPDTDGDDLPDYLDLDSDDDGITDAVEAGPDPSNPIHSDDDGLADYRDGDGDGDGVPERAPDPTVEPNLLAPWDLCPTLREDIDGAEDADGCPEDSDGDDIPDRRDDCRYRSGADGCPEVRGTRRPEWERYLDQEPLVISFEPSGEWRWDITDLDDLELQKLAAPAALYPELAVVIAGCASPEDATGRTDTAQSARVNARYACCRALTVRERFVELGVSEDRVWWGGCPLKSGGDVFTWPEDRVAEVQVVRSAEGWVGGCAERSCATGGACQ